VAEAVAVVEQVERVVAEAAAVAPRLPPADNVEQRLVPTFPRFPMRTRQRLPLIQELLVAAAEALQQRVADVGAIVVALQLVQPPVKVAAPEALQLHKVRR
jgi:hypothetical protein